MYVSLSKFFDKIENLNFVEEESKKELLTYFKSKLSSRIYFKSEDEFDPFLDLVKRLDYDDKKVSKFLGVANGVKNAIARKNNESKYSKPTLAYLEKVYDLFTKTGFDYMLVEKKDSPMLVNISRIVSRLNHYDSLLNNEVSIIELTNQIYEECYASYGYVGKEKNQAIYGILKTLNRIERGCKDISEKEEKLFLSAELKDLFSITRDVSYLPIIDIMNEFYPYFKNELFSIIASTVEQAEEDYENSEDIIKKIRALKEQRIIQQDLSLELAKMENIVNQKVEEAFSDFLNNVQENKYLSRDIKDAITNNISSIMDKYQNEHDEQVQQKLSLLFENCNYYINTIIIPNSSKKDGMEELIKDFLVDTKEFFVEYDGRKFKEIVDFIVNNTNLEIADLKDVGEKCLQIFKDSDVNKLKVAKESLDKFKNFVNSRCHVLNTSIFERILSENPSLLLENENNLKEVVDFLKGEISLKDYGYKGIDFKLDPNFISYDFLKKIMDDDYKLLFNANMNKLVNNLCMLENILRAYDIDFKKFKMTEDMIYLLLSKDISKDNEFVIKKLYTLYNSTDLKNLLESNPNILSMSHEHMSILVERSITNSNQEYNFYDLLASELYQYDFNEFMRHGEKDILTQDFTYVKFPLTEEKNFDAEEILTQGLIIDDSKIGELFAYCYSRDETSITNLLDECKQPDISYVDFHKKLNDLLMLYNKFYLSVPNTKVKEEILSIMDNKLRELEEEKSDVMYEIDETKGKLKDLETEVEDGVFTKNEINNILAKIKSKTIKGFLKEAAKSIDTKVVKAGEINQPESKKKLENLEKTDKELEQRIHKLSYSIDLLENQENPMYYEEMSETKQSITVMDFLGSKLVDDVSDEDRIQEVLGDNNVVLFRDSINLSLKKLDNSNINRLYKFICDKDWGLSSKTFTDNHYGDKSYIEIYTDQREGLASRRQQGSILRVFFVPIKNSYFNCYYVYEIDATSTEHVNAGCSDDSTYNARLEEGRKLSNKIKKMSSEELVQFIKESKEKYNSFVAPIEDAYFNRNKK